MPPPEFWSDPSDRPGVAAYALWPLSVLYALGGRLRRWGVRPMRPPVPVICVGNLVAGGAGKTPTVRALCERLKLRGIKPHILSRGYGGRVTGPHRVDLRQDTAEDVGDEPLLLALDAPVWVGGDRRSTARAAVRAGADVLLMDDGFQNPSLEKDLSFVVIDAGVGHGNGFVMPAGPLREPVRAGFARADCAILIGPRAADRPPPWTPPDAPVLRARLAPETGSHAFDGRRVVAFAGIGRPGKFFETLRDIGADLLETHAFPDHYMYASPLLTRLDRRARELNALLVTTEKDATRLPAAYRDRVVALPVRLGFSDPALVDALLDQALARATARIADARDKAVRRRAADAGGRAAAERSKADRG